MLYVTYTTEDEIYLEGDGADLRSLHDELTAFHSKGVESITASTNCSDQPEGKDPILPGIHLRDSAENLICPKDGRLLISGSKDFFENLARNIPWDAEDPDSGIPYHVHYDRIWPDSPLSENSNDLIITKRRSAA